MSHARRDEYTEPIRVTANEARDRHIPRRRGLLNTLLSVPSTSFEYRLRNRTIGRPFSAKQQWSRPWPNDGRPHAHEKPQPEKAAAGLQRRNHRRSDGHSASPRKAMRSI